jgi:hypothetical protein
MKIAIFAFLMVVVLTLVESQGYQGKGLWGGWGGYGRLKGETDTVDGMRLTKDLNNKLVQLDLGNGKRRYIRDVNKKHHVHMSNERVPAVRVARNAQTLKNVHERMFAVTEDAGK